MRKKTLISVLALLSLFLCSLFIAGCGDEDTVVRKKEKAEVKQEANAKYVVYLITMNQGSNYWKQINDGCEQSAKKYGNLRYEWSAPLNSTNEEQMECIDKAVADGANAILISVISPEGVNPALQRAKDAGVKIIYVDSSATLPGLAIFRTDNEKAGHMAGQVMKKALSEKGITSGIIGVGANKVVKNGILRDKGFRAEFEGTNFTVAEAFEMNGDRRNIKNYVKEHPNYVGYFGANEQITRAMCEQINDMGIKPAVIGFDTSDYTLTQIHSGVIYATMQQKPKKMGSDGIDLAMEALEGKFTGENVDKDMGVDVITRDKI
ncbi:MAG: substrate-binding domain-containing protein [Selenomonadaceae bacterium]|nr:substrate-binding domain-containing protein [Selenomonadaceae bacterium]